MQCNCEGIFLFVFYSSIAVLVIKFQVQGYKIRYIDYWQKMNRFKDFFLYLLNWNKSETWKNRKFELSISNFAVLKTGRQNLRQLNCSFMTISSHFSAIYIGIFHKTEVQTVILRCWIGLNLNWFKNYDTKNKWGSY